MEWVLAALVLLLVSGVAFRRWWQGQWVTPVTDEMIAWQFETFEWLLAHIGGAAAVVGERPLWPDDLSAAAELQGEERAHAVFDAMKARLGIEHWPTKLQRLEPVEHDRTRVTIGTYRADVAAGDGAIAYHPELEESVPKLATVFAHELSHYIIAAIEPDNPGGPDHEEPATDLCAVTLGAGVFATNVSLEPVVDDVELKTILTNPRSIPWASFAYLGLPNFAYALAIIATLQGCTDETAEHLEIYARFEFRRALRDIERRQSDRIEALRRLTGEDVRKSDHPLVHAHRLVKSLGEIEASLERLRALAPPKTKRKRRRRKKRGN